MSKSLAVAAQGVRLVNVPDNATPELIWVTARAVCSAFGAVLFKGDTVDFPNQFAQSIADCACSVLARRRPLLVGHDGVRPQPAARSGRSTPPPR